MELPNNWGPRHYQTGLWSFLEHGGKRAIEIAHRRWGKDDVILHRTACAAHERVANYWHCLPQYEQARKAIWESINPHTGLRRINEAFPISLRKRTDNSSMTIEFRNGSIWKVVGSDHPDSLVGAAPAGIVFSEWALANPSAWAYLAPILTENDGWAAFITTPRGRNHAQAMYEMARKDPAWFAEVSTVDHTQAISPETVEQQRKEYHSIYGLEAGDALIEQEYYCSFEAAILGAIFGHEMTRLQKAGQITKVDIDPRLPIHTVWDLGKGNNMAIWVFQVHFDQVRIVDYLAGFGIGIPSHVKELEARGYTGGTDWVPHDAKVPELGTEKTRIETMVMMGRSPRLVPDHKVEDGINAGKTTFPKCWFDEERCKNGLEALRQYQYEWDDKKKVFRKLPLGNWASHPADAFRYLSMAWRVIKAEPDDSHLPRDPVGKPVKEVNLPKVLQEMSYDEFHKAQPKRRTRV